jgi:hypothetical protein
MVPCPKCHFMNPLKQKGCQACGAALPYALSDAKDTSKGQARSTLRGLRSPESPTDGLSPAEIEAMQGELPDPAPVPRDGTLPSFLAPSAELISRHRDSVTSTIVGLAIPQPAAVQATAPPPESIAPPTPKERAANSGSQPNVSFTGDMPRPSAIGRTLLGHVAPDPTPEGVTASQTSQTLPSMQAVTPESLRSHKVQTFHDPGGVRAEQASSPEHDVPGDAGENAPFIGFEEGPADSPARTSSRKDGPNTAKPRTFRFRDDPKVTIVTPTPVSSYAHAVSPVSKAIPIRTGAPESIRDTNVRLGRRVLIIASLLLLGLTLFALLWTPPEPPTARLVGVGDNTTLEVSCNTCDDGSLVTIGGQKAQFANHKAGVPLPRPLNLGFNDIEIEIERTGFGRNERMRLEFPIDYRLAWDLAGLAQTPPVLGISVEAALGVTVSLDGQLVRLIDNKGLHPVSIATDLMGPSATEQWLEKSVAVAIGGGRASIPPDHVSLKIPIVPLVVDTPWDGFMTADDTTVVSGRSTPNTKLTVAGNPTTTDADGYFELALETAPGLNTFTISAHAEGHAPRFVNVSLTKVPSVHKAALEYQTTAVNRFDELTKQLEPPDASVRVALPGKVQESKVHGSTTVSLVSIHTGCPTRTCVLRVVYPTRLELKTNERVAVFGVASLVATGSSPQSTLPEVRAHLLLR